jgi:hypothetical protein
MPGLLSTAKGMRQGARYRLNSGRHHATLHAHLSESTNSEALHQFPYLPYQWRNRGIYANPGHKLAIPPSARRKTGEPKVSAENRCYTTESDGRTA